MPLFKFPAERHQQFNCEGGPTSHTATLVCAMEKERDGKTDQTELQEVGNSTQDVNNPSRRVYHFGCGPCHPGWLQCLANAKVYTLLFALFVVVEGAVVSGKSLLCMNRPSTIVIIML